MSSTPRAYLVRMYYGETAVEADDGTEYLVVLDLAPGDAAADIRDRLDEIGERIAQQGAIPPGQLRMCHLVLTDHQTGMPTWRWLLGRRR
jgi:hypothetical protein